VLEGEVDEVVAETFLVAWRRLDDVPPYPLPWLLGVARGVTANVRRSARRRDALHQRLAAHDHVSRQGGPPATQVDRVAVALHRLRDGDREVLTLVAWDGLSHEEAAESLGCSRRTFAVRLHRARRRLRAELDREPGPDRGPARTVELPRPQEMSAR
jgi:RNA polymerase sigma-70 factor (ECF subfamily)